MANTIQHFRDTLTIDQGTILALTVQGGDTIVFGARSITLKALVSGFSYVIAADELNVAPGAVTAITTDNPEAPSSITVLARTINGALNLACSGGAGDNGADGEPGESGVETDPETGRPVILPGGAGGNGENGGDGAPGGNITVRYAAATTTPTGTAPGGAGGAGGKGGAGVDVVAVCGRLIERLTKRRSGEAAAVSGSDGRGRCR